MTKKNIAKENLVLEIMERIDVLQLHIAAVDSASSHVSRMKHQGFSVDTGNLRSALVEEELREWRQLFMWGLVIKDDTRERIKAAAYQRFLDERQCCAHWLNPQGLLTSGWLSADEDEFRAMVKQEYLSDKLRTEKS